MPRGKFNLSSLLEFGRKNFPGHIGGHFGLIKSKFRTRLSVWTSKDARMFTIQHMLKYSWKTFFRWANRGLSRLRTKVLFWSGIQPAGIEPDSWFFNVCFWFLAFPLFIFFKQGEYATKWKKEDSCIVLQHFFFFGFVSLFGFIFCYSNKHEHLSREFPSLRWNLCCHGNNGRSKQSFKLSLFGFYFFLVTFKSFLGEDGCLQPRSLLFMVY